MRRWNFWFDKRQALLVNTSRISVFRLSQMDRIHLQTERGLRWRDGRKTTARPICSGKDNPGLAPPAPERNGLLLPSNLERCRGSLQAHRHRPDAQFRG